MGLTNITDADHEDALINNTSKLIIFYMSNNCGHCLNIKPYFEELSDEFPEIIFAQLDKDKIKVQNLVGVPTFVGYINGQAKSPVIGADKIKLVALINSL